MRSVPVPLFAAAAAAILAVSCSHAPPPNEPGGVSSVPPSAPESPGSTGPGSIPGKAPGTEPQAPPPPTGPPNNPSMSAVGDYHQVIKLYRANLSENFIIDQVRREHRVYHLNADDVIALRDAGVSERVIQAMLDSGRTAVAPRPVPEDAVTVGAGYERALPAAGSTGGFAGTVHEPGIRWEGLARRENGVLLFKDRWRVGTLTLEDGQLRWMDARDSSKNLLVPVNAIAEQFVTCLKRPGGNECFEWGIRTVNGDTYRFRDVAWQQGVDSRPLAVHEEFRSRFPNLVDSERDVDEKEK